MRGRRGTNSHLPSFCVAGVAQTHIYHRLAWQAWHSWHCVKLLGRFSRFMWQAWYNLTHHLSHTTLSHTIFHTTSSHTIFHPQLCHAPSFPHSSVTHNFVTHTTPLQPQLQLVSQVRLVICIQRCSHRIIYCCSGRFGPKLFAGTFASLRLRHVFCSELFLS